MFERLSSLEEKVLRTIAESEKPFSLGAESLPTCKKLLEAGYIFGRPTYQGFEKARITLAGESYFTDLEEAQKLEEEEERSSRLHDYKIAVFGVLGGAVAGALASILLSLLGVT